MKRPILLLIVLVLTGCASTGVVHTGNNEYMISKTDYGDTWSEGAKVLAKLYVEANEFCAQKIMALERISEESAPGRVFVRNASATLRFRCIDKQR
jgi:hypothetical protein